MRSKVSLVKSNGHFKGVQKSLEPIKEDIKESLSKISPLVIKINLVSTKTPRHSGGVELPTTLFQAVKSFADFISPLYKGEIVIAEEAAWGDTKEGFRMYGFAKLAEANSQIKLLNLKEDGARVLHKVSSKIYGLLGNICFTKDWIFRSAGLSSPKYLSLFGSMIPRRQDTL